MSTSPSRRLSDYDIRHEGWKALTERLGAAGAIRFLTQYDPGRGEYTEERREMFQDVRVESLVAELKGERSDRGRRASARSRKR